MNEKYLKLMLLTYVPHALESVQTIYAVRLITRRIVNDVVVIEHKAFVYEYRKNQKIRIIIERIGQDSYHFLSVMPHKD